MPGLATSEVGRATIVHAPGPPAAMLADDVRIGLTAVPKHLSCRFLYDAEGSRLFEAICRLPEYYPTRTEDGILRASACAMMADFAEPPALIELGSGSSTKTRRLIAAGLECYGSLNYLPIDISPTILAEAARDLTRRYRGLSVTGFAGDYRPALSEIARRVAGPKLVAFLGSSLGNYARADAVDLLREMARAAGPDGKVLLGTDMVKDRVILEAAYDDQQGVTARFNLNLLARINRELGADFDPFWFEHEARYNEAEQRVEMHLVSRREQCVSIPGAAVVARFRAGERIHTENSQKYTTAGLERLAFEAGLRQESAWSDPRGWFLVQRLSMAS